MSCEWYFDELSQKESRQGDIPTKHALEADVETFVREVLQNANDAGPIDGDRPIEVTFRFRQLHAGDGLEEFKEAFHWDDQLLRHLKGAAGEEKDLSLQQFLENETDHLVLLSVEDKNTAGLSGAEDADESNYTALVRDMHRSNKEETQGGIHGVGGTVLWAFSGISTVLFTSIPHDTSDGTPPRFVGRSYLPDHTISGDLYKGYGWFGRLDPDDPDGRHVSVWGEDASEIASKLRADRPDTLGTNATVVGFREPGEPQPTGESLEDLIQKIQTAAVENFWPAIRRHRLRVYVKGPDDDERRPADFDSVDSVRPFISAYQDLYKEGGTLGEPGATASKDITFPFPERSDGAKTPTEGEVTLSARTAGPAEEELRNQVAVFRGAGMVVQYVNMDDVSKYGADFHAVLACGQARTDLGEDPSFVDRHVERLLRAAEPAAHNEWTGTPRLKNEYTGRRVGTVKDLQGRLLRDELREIVATSDDDAGERLDGFQKHFPVGSTGGGSGGGGTSTSTPGPLNRDLHELVFDADHWEFEATLDRAGDEGGWAARVWMTQLFEDGGDGERLAIEGFELVDGPTSANLRLDDGELIVESHDSEPLTIRCTSKATGPPDPTSGRTSRTGVRHELLEKGGI